MANESDRNYVSVWFWMLAIIVMAIPCVGLVMVLIWAFVGDNESRKNFFRAQILLVAILLIIAVALVLLGVLPGNKLHFNWSPTNSLSH